RHLARHMTGFQVVVDNSTVPGGTGDKVRAAVGDVLAMRGKSDIGFSVVSNPEFLKEGAAVDDFMRPDRIVLGTYGDADGLRAKAIMRTLYA
ncbi:UDP-glucose 6-dehydrogenase, partial [Mycobacterium tuberculosis]|nr:UDP-glucose 6-dehydrogenase [Mycobacterium tuberculosis]